MSQDMWANRLTAAFGASPGAECGSRPTAGPQEPMMSVVSDDRYFGVYPAVVTSNNDPFGFGRVQVTVPMVATNDALWATVVVPCTGEDGGFRRQWEPTLSSRSRRVIRGTPTSWARSRGGSDSTEG
jgi:hypothetical protein